MLDNKLVIINKDLGNFKTELVDILVNDKSIFNYQKLITITAETVKYNRNYTTHIEYYNLVIKLSNNEEFRLEFRNCINYSNGELVVSEFTDDLDAIKTTKLLQEISNLDKINEN